MEIGPPSPYRNGLQLPCSNPFLVSKIFFIFRGVHGSFQKLSWRLIQLATGIRMHTSMLITMHMKFPCLWSLQNSNCCTRLPRLVPMGPTMGLTWWTAAAGHRVRERNVSDQLKKLSTYMHQFPPNLITGASSPCRAHLLLSALHHTRHHLPLVQITCDYAEQLRTATQSLAIAIT